MSIENYALKILADSGCDCYTYGGEWAKHIMDDLKKAFPDGMEFPYIDVANAILAISRPHSIVRAPWRMVWNTADNCDGAGYESFDAAKSDAEDTLVNWIADECSRWKSDQPTQKERESFNQMIYDCSVQVDKYNPDTDEYEEYWSPSYEDERLLGWEAIEEFGENKGRHERNNTC